MVFDDPALLAEFVTESREHLAGIEEQLLDIEAAGADIDVDLVNTVFRAVHSIKGAAGFMGLDTLGKLAHSLENVLGKIRTCELTPTSAIVDVMLKAADALTGLVNDIENSNDVDVSHLVAVLDEIYESGNLEDQVQAAESSEPEPIADDSPAVEAIASADTPAPETEPDASVTAVEKPESEPSGDSESANQAAASRSTSTADKSIRVQVGVLDSLMNIAGELVLGRNQLLQTINAKDQAGIEAVAAKVDQVTSELQEAIMQTRMQPIGTVFSRFPRIVRDLGSKLGKQCELNIEGKEVEVDKTIIEAIGDPLTHLVRNSVDHGVELPADREKAGKPIQGTMNLRAYYQAGKVRIEIEDDGAGIDPHKLREKAISKGILSADRAEQMSDREATRLIFHPGFSTAAKVTDVSGRGVGMDVVRTNIAKLGGTIEIESVVGAGTNIVITLPLTLAIIPSLIVQCRDDRYAIPQVNIAELVRLRPEEIETRVGRIKDSEVLRLRGDLLPLIRLEDVLEMNTTISDQLPGEPTQPSREATNIIVVETGQQRFGVVVDALHDSEEIVVKPLGRHLNECPCLSGATILGDGHVALILDVAGIAGHEQIPCNEEVSQEQQGQVNDKEEDTQYMLLFSNHAEEHFAVAMDVVSRIERVHTNQIDSVGGQSLLQYRESTMSLLRLEDCITAKPADSNERIYIIVFEVSGKEVGLIVPQLEDIRGIVLNVDTTTFRERGVLGSMVLEEKTTRLVDLFELASIAHPEWHQEQDVSAKHDDHPPLVLLAEDSTFFRKQVTSMVSEYGYRVIDCEDGQVAWDTLQSSEHDFDVVVTDIEMPNMDGFELSDRIKQSDNWKHIPIIALTSLAGSADIHRGIEVGIDDYQIKMDREKLLNSLHNFTGSKAGNNLPTLQTS